MPFAQQSGLKLDEQSGVIYGNYQGYDITILPTGGGKTFQLSFSVKRGEEAPNITEMQKLTRLYKSLFLGAVTDRYSVSFNIKSAGLGASATVNNRCTCDNSYKPSRLCCGDFGRYYGRLHA